MSQDERESDVPKAYFTIKQIAERWLCSERKVRRVITKGELIVHQFGGLLRIGHDDLRTYERRNRMA